MALQFSNLQECLTKYNSQRKIFIIILSILVILLLLILCVSSAITTLGLVEYEIKKKEK